MADEIDVSDPEHMWPPFGATLPPATGPQITNMRLDSLEMRLANLEYGRGDAGRQLVDMAEAVKVAIDALTYLSGAVERLTVLVGQIKVGNSGD